MADNVVGVVQTTIESENRDQTTESNQNLQDRFLSVENTEQRESDRNSQEEYPSEREEVRRRLKRKKIRRSPSSSESSSSSEDSSSSEEEKPKVKRFKATNEEARYKWCLPKSMAKYVNKNFNEFINDKQLKESILLKS